MHYERRCATAVLVAVGVTGLSVLLPLAMGVVGVALFLVALGLVVYATAIEDGTLQQVRRSAAVWLACALLAAAVFTPGGFGPLALRALGAAALVDAMGLWWRTRRPAAAALAERTRSSERAS